MGKITYKDKFTCVMPFYDESFTSVVLNAREVLKVKEIDYLVIIDDGSKSIATYNILRFIFMNRPNVDIVRLDNNLGKTFAVLQALKYVDTENVFLCDSDLNNLDNEEISNAIAKYDLLNLNMLILRRLNINFFPKIIRSDTLLSGERILRKMDLIKVIKSGVKGYQLEVAINQYFIDNGLQRNCYWSPSSAVNNYKFKKINFFKGVFKDVKMHVNLIRYIGIVNFTKQVFSFCKQNV